MSFNDNGISVNEASNVTNIVVQDQNTSSSNLTNESLLNYLRMFVCLVILVLSLTVT